MATLIPVLGCLALAPSASAMSGGNLVVDGDGEPPNGMTPWTPTAWTSTTGGLTATPYGLDDYPASILVPGGTFGGTFDGQTQLIYSTGAGTTVVNEQTIVLSADDQAAIDTGTVRARLSAYIGGYANQADRIGVDVAWYGASSELLATQSLAPVTNVERGNVSGFLRRDAVQAVPAGARTALVKLTGTRVTGAANDGYIDNIDLRLVGIPQVGKAFSASRVEAGRPVRMTYTIENSEDLEAKTDWSFSDDLPDGLMVASTAKASTTCGDGQLVATRTRISVAGSLGTGQAGCTASFDVSGRPGEYLTGAKQLNQVVGLRIAGEEAEIAFLPPDDGGDPGTDVPVVVPPIVVPPVTPLPVPPPTPEPVRRPPFLRPALRVSTTPSARRIASGSTVRLKLRAWNPTTTPAARVRVCQAFPSGLRFVSSTVPALGSSSSRRCWTVGRLAGGASWTAEVTARVTADAGSRLRPRVTAMSPDAVGEPSARASVRVAGASARAVRSRSRATR